MKKGATQTTKNIYRAGNMAGDESCGSAAAQPDGNQELVDLVWKHFREEITEILREVQKDLLLGAGGARHQENQQSR